MKFLTYILSAALCALLCSGSVFAGGAQTLTVTKTADTNDNACDADCSLREAIAAANGGDAIVFSPTVFSTPQTITLTLGELQIDKNLTITGTGARRLALSGNNASRIFSILLDAAENAPVVNISGFVIVNGLSAGGGGGAINNEGVLTLTNCWITENTAALFGGGIANDEGGTLNLISSTVSNNTSNGNFSGGGIDNAGDLNVVNSTVSGNVSPVDGGGGFNGGGIWTSGATTISNSTIADNEAAGANSAGGVLEFNTDVAVRSSIIAANRNNGVTPDVFSIFAVRQPSAKRGFAKLASANLRRALAIKRAGEIRAFTSGGYNLIGNPGNNTFSATGDQSGTAAAPLNPQLRPLRLYGGTTPAHNFASASSPAIDKGNAFGLTVDQQGRPRPFDNPNIVNAADGTDIGAFELQATTAAAVALNGRVVTADKRGIANATVYLTPVSGETRTARTNAFGYFSFAEVPGGAACVVNVYAKRYTFPAQALTLTDETGDLVFVAN